MDSNICKRVIIDTDVEIDDWMAMLYLLNHECIDVVGITVVGTGAGHLDPGLRNALDLVQLAGYPSLPVAKGLDKPMAYTHKFPNSMRTSMDALFGITLPTNPNSPLNDAQAFLREQLTCSKEKPTILAIGPLTNLGTLLQWSPELAGRIERIYVMGGAINATGNAHDADRLILNRVAEWNIYCDPVAADIVFQSGAPITLVPLDATLHAPVTLDFYNRLSQYHVTPSAEFIYRTLTANHDFITTGSFDFWDPLTAAILTDGNLGSYKEVCLSVITEDNIQSGQLILQDDGVPINSYYNVNALAFEDLFLETINH